MRNSHHSLSSRCWKLGSFTILVCLSLVSSTLADVVVRLKDGRIVRGGQLGSETSSAKVAIVYQRGRITLTRSFRWSIVRSISVDGEEQDMNDLVRRFNSQAPNATPKKTGVTLGRPISVKTQTVSHVDHRDRYPLPRKSYAVSEAFPHSGKSGCCDSRGYRPQDLYCRPLPIEARVIGVRDDPLETYGDSFRRFFPQGVSPGEAGFIIDLMRAKKSQEIYQSIPKAAPPKPMPPKSPTLILNRLRPIHRIDIRAAAINSRGQSDWDALDVELVGYDRNGAPVAVRGTVEWTLRGREQRVMRASDLRFTVMPGRPKTLATWTRSADSPLNLSTNTIHSAARRNGSSRFLLPFPEPLPAHNLNIASWGELSARVLVPGQGVFVARAGGIPLRKLGFVRAGLVGETGSLFFPQDSTYGRRYSIPHLMGGQSSFRPNHGILSVQP